MIPRIIHYCWLSNDPYPEDFVKYQNTWKQHLSDYEFVLWNFDRFDINSSLWVKQAFEAKKYAFAADYIRLYALYNYGGIYMDMDIEVIKPFDDELLNRELLVGYETEDQKEIEGGFIGCSKGNPFVKKCLDFYKDKEFVLANGDYDMKPLPSVITPIFRTLDYPKPFPYNYFTTKSWKSGNICITPNTYTVHHFADSWITEVHRKILRFYKRAQQKYPFFIATVMMYFYGLFVRLKNLGLKKTIRHYITNINN